MQQIDAIINQLPIVTLNVIRIAALIAVAPVLSLPVVPRRTRVALAILLGVASLPALTATGAMDGAATGWAGFLPLAIGEVAVGLLLGFAVALPLLGVQGGGVLVGQQMGLGFARLVDPASTEGSDPITRALVLTVTISFLAVGGHEQLLLGVLHSFHHLPAGEVSLAAAPALLSGLLLASFELALRVAAPLLAVVFLEVIALGFVAKTIPHLNILSIGFPLRVLTGLLVIIAGLVITRDVFLVELDSVLSIVGSWMESA